jgi:hypothetical protein
MAATSPIASIWTLMSLRLYCLLLHRPGVVLSCQLVVASPLVVPPLRRPLVVLSRQLVVTSPLAVLSLRCPLAVLSRQLVVTLPLAVLSLRHPLVNSLRQLASPRALVALRAALLSSRHAGWLLRPFSTRRPLVVLLSCHTASRCLVAPAGCCAIISRRPLVAPPSRRPMWPSG